MDETILGTAEVSTGRAETKVFKNYLDWQNSQPRIEPDGIRPPRTALEVWNHPYQTAKRALEEAVDGNVAAAKATGKARKKVNALQGKVAEVEREKMTALKSLTGEERITAVTKLTVELEALAFDLADAESVARLAEKDEKPTDTQHLKAAVALARGTFLHAALKDLGGELILKAGRELALVGAIARHIGAAGPSGSLGAAIDAAAPNITSTAFWDILDLKGDPLELIKGFVSEAELHFEKTYGGAK